MRTWFSLDGLDNLYFGQKALLLVLVPLCLQLLLIGLFWWLLQRLEDERALAAESRDVIESVAEARSHSAVAFNRYTLGAILGDRKVMADAEHSEIAAKHELGRLIERLHATPEAREQALRMHELFLEVMNIAKSSAQLVRADSTDVSTPQHPIFDSPSARAIFLSNARDALRARERFLDIFAAFEKEQRLLSGERRNDVAQSVQLASVLVLVDFVAYVLLSMLMLLLFQAHVSRRVRRIVGNLHQLSNDLPLGPELGGLDEISKIDRAIHQLAHALKEKTIETELFLYSVSHDLRSPLVNLHGFSDELRLSCNELRDLLDRMHSAPESLEKARTLLDRDFERSFSFIKAAVDRLATIIDALLRLSRAGRVNYKREMIPLEPLVNRIVSSLRSSIGQRSAEVRVYPLPEVWGDASALEQIFANLLTNAVNYLDAERPGLIEVGVADEGEGSEMATIFVRDNGMGIPEEAQKKLYLAFQRFHSTKTPGEGIGLALVRRVVSRLRGSIRCESSPGRGTTFFVSLPRTSQDASEFPDVASFEIQGKPAHLR